MYKLIMLSTKHCDHNVVTAGLDALQNLLQSPPRKLLYQLLSQQGLVAFSNPDRSGLYVVLLCLVVTPVQLNKQDIGNGPFS